MDQALVWIVIAGFIALGVWYNRYLNEQAAEGADKIVCPHCQAKGHVTGKAVVRSKGISGGKATAGLLTAGLSLPFAGLSKNQHARELHCSNCNSTWDV